MKDPNRSEVNDGCCYSVSTVRMESDVSAATTSGKDAKVRTRTSSVIFDQSYDKAQHSLKKKPTKQQINVSKR